MMDLLGNLAFPLILLGSLLLRSSTDNPGGPNLPFGLGRYERNYFFGSGYETVLILQTCFEPVYKPVQELAFSLEPVQLKNFFFCLKNGLKLK